jgi:hypothetical protein
MSKMLGTLLQTYIRRQGYAVRIWAKPLNIVTFCVVSSVSPRMVKQTTHSYLLSIPGNGETDHAQLHPQYPREW